MPQSLPIDHILPALAALLLLITPAVAQEKPDTYDSESNEDRESSDTGRPADTPDNRI